MSDIRLAELMAALSIATDYGMGQPLEFARLRLKLFRDRLRDDLERLRDDLERLRDGMNVYI